jgi:hypothetical protein
MEQFKSVSLRMISPFRSPGHLWQRHRRVIRLRRREYGSTLRQWPCDAPTRAASNGSQFIQPNRKDTLCGGMEGPFGRWWEMKRCIIARVSTSYFKGQSLLTPTMTTRRSLIPRCVWRCLERNATNWHGHSWILWTTSTIATLCTTTCHPATSFCIFLPTPRIKSTSAFAIGPWLGISMIWRNLSTSTRDKRQGLG